MIVVYGVAIVTSYLIELALEAVEWKEDWTRFLWWGAFWLLAYLLEHVLEMRYGKPIDKSDHVDPALKSIFWQLYVGVFAGFFIHYQSIGL